MKIQTPKDSQIADYYIQMQHTISTRDLMQGWIQSI